jgi:hypothetical protein
MKRRNVIGLMAVVAFAGGMLVATDVARAMPTGPSTILNGDVMQVAGGCGRGFHRGPYGGCRQNWANPAAHACPRGYHIGPGGRCRGNGR